MTSGFEGKVALVTGGARGIGRAVSEALAHAGCDLIIASRKPAACQAVAAELEGRYGRRAVGIACNVGDWEDCGRLAETAYLTFGRIDILVNNAGISPPYDGVENVSEALFDKIIAVNVKGPFRLSALIGTRMIADGGGAIVNIGSSSASHPVPTAIPYSLAKAGVTNMTKAMAGLMGPTVRVNCVQPAGTATDMNNRFSDEEIRDYARDYAMKRFARPEEIAGAVLYLASDAASFTTGAILRVDGGLPG